MALAETPVAHPAAQCRDGVTVEALQIHPPLGLSEQPYDVSKAAARVRLSLTKSQGQSCYVAAPNHTASGWKGLDLNPGLGILWCLFSCRAQL